MIFTWKLKSENTTWRRRIHYDSWVYKNYRNWMVYPEFGLSGRAVLLLARGEGLFVLNCWGEGRLMGFFHDLHVRICYNCIDYGHWTVGIVYSSLSITIRLECKGFARLQREREELAWLQAEISVVVTGNYMFVVKLKILDCRWLRRVMSPEQEITRDEAKPFGMEILSGCDGISGEFGTTEATKWVGWRGHLGWGEWSLGHVSTSWRVVKLITTVPPALLPEPVGGELNSRVGRDPWMP